MREFGSGILGCIICILALMGSILGGFCLGVEGDTREVTNFDYKTDLTGTFATDTAPEYIDYSPAANFMGYSRSSVDYSRTNVANAYKYVVSYPNDTTVNNTISNETTYAQTALTQTTDAETQLLLNVTGGGYDYGASKTSSGITYNVVANTANNLPKATTLYYMISSFSTFNNGHGNLTITVNNNGSYPILMMPNTPSYINVNDGTSNYWCIYYATVSAHPTSLVWNLDNNNVTVYNGGTALFTSPITSINVLYSYKYNAGGTLTEANVNTTFSATGTQNRSLYVGANSDFPDDVLSVNTTLRIFNTSQSSGYPQPQQSAGGTFTVCVANYTGVTALSNIFSSVTLPTDREITITISQGSYQTIVSSQTPQNQSINTPDSSYPTGISYTPSTGTCVILRNGLIIGGTNVSNLYVIYNVINDTNNQPFGTSSTWNFEWQDAQSVTVTGNSSYSAPYYLLSDVKTDMHIKWNGEQNLGSDMSYNDFTYNIVLAKKSSLPYVPTLYSILSSMNIEYFSSIDLQLTYGSYPVLFYTGSLTPVTMNIGNGSQKIYELTLDDNNKPDRIVITSGTAQLFKENTLIDTKPINQVYVINAYSTMSGGSLTLRTTGVTFNGTATTDSAPVSLTVDNSSSYPSDGYTFSLPDADSSSPRYIRPLLQYTGTQFSNMGDSITFNAINKTANIMLSNGQVGDTTYYLTKFRNFLNDIGMSTYESVDLSITYGTHPLIFIRGSWDYYFSHQTYHDQGGTVHYYYNYYWQSIDDSAFPDRITVDKATYRVHAYKNGTEIWSANADSLQVAYKYWTLDDLGAYNAYNVEEVTNQSMTAQGSGKLTPTYAYADPTKGVVLHTPFTDWSNGYQNNEINITVTKQNWSNNDLTISAGASSITIERRSAGGLYVTVNKYDGTTETRNMGNWYSAQVTINASEGWVAVTPIAGAGMPNFTSAVDLGDTTVFWNNWYNGGDIETLTFSTTDTSMRWAVTETSVFLNTYGIVMNNPSIDVTEYFPEMDEWRLNFFSFALIGDSMTVNNQTFPVNTATQTITVTGEDGNTVSGELTNVYITQADDHTYFNFANSNKTVDLGETVSNTVSFSGLWYFTTGLFEVTQGTEKFYDWHLDGNLHATIPQMCLMFLGILIAALILCKAILRMEIGAVDWIILICAAVISLIVAGGNL